MVYNATFPIGPDNRRLILDLIKEDIKNNQLINGFDSLYIDISAYALDLHAIVFELMGFNYYPDSLYEEYFKFMRKVPPIDDKNSPTELSRLAQELYAQLLEAKKDFSA